MIQFKAILAGTGVFLVSYAAYVLLFNAAQMESTFEDVQWLHVLVLAAIFMLSGFATGRVTPVYPVMISAIVGILVSSVVVIPSIFAGFPVSAIVGQVLPALLFACLGGLFGSRTSRDRKGE